MLSLPAPFITACGLSAAIAFAAWRMRSLSLSGAVAAALLGIAALRASWGMGCYLIAWFVLATLLSKVGKERKAARTSGIVEKGSKRDAWQVMANGGVYFLCCLLVIFVTRSGFEGSGYAILFTLAGAGALTAAGADTWATEVGTLFGGAPWSLRTLSRVPVGTSGAITVAGTLAMVAGAITLALLAWAFQLFPAHDVGRTIAALTAGSIAVGGVVGASVDTLVGAWLQERRWCPRCTVETEQAIHRCGTPTVHHRGMRSLNNDRVNVLCSLTGAITTMAVLLSWSLRT